MPVSGTTLLFAPGGGYGSLSLPNAQDLCEWSGAIGAHFVLLKYRVPRSPDDPGRRIPLSDAQRAVRLLRSKAQDLGIDATKIIMAGSSAGGHLAFNLTNNYDEATYDRVDDSDDRSAKPNASLLFYPAYLTKPIESLETDPHLNLDQLSPSRTPPVFIAVTRPDKFTWGAVDTMLHLRRAKVPSEIHVYPEGGHGGMFNKYPLMEFARPAARFFRDQGLFADAMLTASDAWLDRLESTFLERDETSSRSANPTTPPGELDRKDFSSGDIKLSGLRDPQAAVFSIWPGDGRRADDSLTDIDESVPDKGDGILRVTNVTRPTLHYWPADNADGRSVIVFPGGGYNILAAEHEGTDVARWLNTQGITAFVAKYRVPRRKSPLPYQVAIQDAQRAIRFVRARATDFGIDPQKIGVLGFSAGGNLSALTVHKAAESSYEPIDSVDEVSAKPNFAILIYPAYLAKENKDQERDPTIQPLDSRNDYPPIYMAVAADDKFAPGSLHYMLHLHQMKVPGELHVYESGGHGKGLRESGGPFAQWTRSCARWLSDLKHERGGILLE